jgi:Flp pilus assembly secretin CpaC
MTVATSFGAAALLLSAGNADELADGMPLAELNRGASLERKTSSVTVVLDFAKILSFSKPARTIIIGNPAIVDGTLNDENTIVLTGKASGTTNMIVIGEAGEEIADLTVTVAANTRQLTTVHHGAAQQTYSCTGPCRSLGATAESK